MSAGETFHFIMREGPTPGNVFDLSRDVITIGRDAGNDVVASDAEVSRHHARLVREGAGYVLEDLASTNGTFVNGHRITGPQALHNGDVIGLGESVILVFENPAPDVTETMTSGMAEAPARSTGKQPDRRGASPVSAPPAPPRPEPRLYAPPFPPAMEMEVDEEPAAKSNATRWILAGCGCLLFLACIGVAVFLWFAPCSFYDAIGVIELFDLSPCPPGSGYLPVPVRGWLL